MVPVPSQIHTENMEKIFVQKKYAKFDKFNVIFENL